VDWADAGQWDVAWPPPSWTAFKTKHIQYSYVVMLIIINVQL